MYFRFWSLFLGATILGWFGGRDFSYGAPSNSGPLISKWDKALPAVVLGDVNIQAQDVWDAWQKISRAFMIRSTLFITKEDHVKSPFRFRSNGATAADVHKAFLSQYPNLTNTEDPITGILWFHPKTISYSNILSQHFVFEQDAIGLRLLSDLDSRLSAEADAPFFVFVRGASAPIFGNFQMDIPKGTWTARDLVNFICLANPLIAPCLRTGFGPKTELTISWLYNEGMKTPPPGLMELWRQEIDFDQRSNPSADEILAALSNTKEPRIRWAAKAFLARMNEWLPTTDWLGTQARNRALWLAVAMLEIKTRVPERTSWPPAVDRIKSELTSEFIQTGDPQLVLLCSLHMARLRSVEDTAPLEAFLKQNPADHVLDGILSDVARMTRDSEKIRKLIRTHKPDWTLTHASFLSDDPNQKIFRLADPH